MGKKEFDNSSIIYYYGIASPRIKVKSILGDRAVRIRKVTPWSI